MTEVFQKLIKSLQDWAVKDKRINAILLVGSYARCDERADSDVDLVLISDNKQSLLELDWIDEYGKPSSYAKEEYGACTSIRVFYDDLEVEYGLVDTSWLAVPLDDGTRRVLSDGYKVIFGSNGITNLRIKELLETKDEKIIDLVYRWNTN